MNSSMDSDLMDTGEEAKDPIPLPLLTLDILLHVKSAQMQNGLRHGDFKRYRTFCARRLKRLRKAANFSHGAKKTRGYIARELQTEGCTMLQHICIPLMNAERAWGYAMQLKQDASLVGDDDSRRRFHLMRRLAKAARWSQKLRDICAVRCDDRTSLEAEAYAGWMTGNVLLEKEDWGAALAQFAKAKEIYEQLASVGSADQRDLFSDRVEEIDPSIRYCQYNHSRETGEEVDLMSMRMLATSSSKQGGGIDLVQSKLEKVLSESRKQAAIEDSNVRWQGKEVPVRSERVRLALLRATDAVNTLRSLEENSESSPEYHQRRETGYLEAFSAYDEALSGVREEVARITKAKQGAKGESLLAELAAIDAYVRCLKQGIGIRRSEMLAEQMVERMRILSSTNDDAATSVSRSITGIRQRASSSTKLASGSSFAVGGGERRVRPEDVVRLYEKALQSCTELNSMLTDDDERHEILAATAIRLKACRCLYIAEAYSTRRPPQWCEAHILYERVLDLVDEASAAFADCNGMSDVTQAVAIADENTKLKALEKSARGGKCLAQACAFMVRAEKIEAATSEAQESLASTSLEENLKESTTGMKRKAGQYLLDRLEVFDSGIASDDNSESADQASAPHGLIATPPDMESIPGKPFFFDVAFNKMRVAPGLIERLDARAGQASKRKKKIAAARRSVEEQQGGGGWFGGWFSGKQSE